MLYTARTIIIDESIIPCTSLCRSYYFCMVKVSIVIPIYNVGKYIDRCARSLFEQSLSEIEYIFVDDCTPDNSMDILANLIEEYPKRKNQIRIIRHQTNQGLACSRIDGIKIAKGKYIAHCDSDDWVDVDLYEKLYDRAEETDADLTICDFVCEYTSRRRCEKIVTTFNCTPRQALMNMHNESFYCMVWRCLFKREFVLEYNIFPLPHVDMWEDTCVTLPAFYYANKIAKVNDSVYHYFINDHSMCANSARPKLYTDRKSAILYLESFFADKKDFDATLLISFWKMLAKSYMLTTSDFNPIRWRHEYSEAHKYILDMHAIPFKLRYLYKITSITTYPIRLMMWLKK